MPAVDCTAEQLSGGAQAGVASLSASGSRINRSHYLYCLLLVCLMAWGGPVQGEAIQAHWRSPIVHGADSAYMNPEHWISRLSAPDRPYLSAQDIARQNARMLALDASMTDLARLAQTLSGEDVAGRIRALSKPPTRRLYTQDGVELDRAALEALQADLALDAVPETVRLRFGLTASRADLRTFPTLLRVFSEPGQHDIDRFQESALFPGDAVVVLHESLDGAWWFVASQRYQAWVLKSHIALGTREEVLGFARRTPARIVTGSIVHTAIAPDTPALSALPLDMGVRLPLRTDWPLDRVVNGQLAHAAWIVDVPVRDEDGGLRFSPALLPLVADSAADALPLTAANLIKQAFKFLGERYGWGHSYGARDCSGLVSEVYRSLGILLPRNTGTQAASPALDSIALPNDREGRLAVLRNLRVGDLVYIPGHVMMVIGHDAGMTFVIHDTAGTGYTDAAGQFVRAPLNGVVVTPLEPLQLDPNTFYIDKITAIQRLPHAHYPD